MSNETAFEESKRQEVLENLKKIFYQDTRSSDFPSLITFAPEDQANFFYQKVDNPKELAFINCPRKYPDKVMEAVYSAQIRVFFGVFPEIVCYYCIVDDILFVWQMTDEQKIILEYSFDKPLKKPYKPKQPTQPTQPPQPNQPNKAQFRIIKHPIHAVAVGQPNYLHFHKKATHILVVATDSHLIIFPCTWNKVYHENGAVSVLNYHNFKTWTYVITCLHVGNRINILDDAGGIIFAGDEVGSIHLFKYKLPEEKNYLKAIAKFIIHPYSSLFGQRFPSSPLQISQEYLSFSLTNHCPSINFIHSPVKQLVYDEANQFLAQVDMDSQLTFYRADFESGDYIFTKRNRINQPNVLYTNICLIPFSDSENVRFVAFTTEAARHFYCFEMNSIIDIPHVREPHSEWREYGALIYGLYQLGKTTFLFREHIVITSDSRRIDDNTLNPSEKFIVINLSQIPVSKFNTVTLTANLNAPPNLTSDISQLSEQTDDNVTVNAGLGLSLFQDIHFFSTRYFPIFAHQFLFQHFTNIPPVFVMSQNGASIISFTQPVDEFKALLDNYKGHFSQEIHKKICERPDEMCATILLLASRNPDQYYKQSLEIIKSFSILPSVRLWLDSLETKNPFYVRVTRLLSPLFESNLFEEVDKDPRDPEAGRQFVLSRYLREYPRNIPDFLQKVLQLCDDYMNLIILNTSSNNINKTNQFNNQGNSSSSSNNSQSGGNNSSSTEIEELKQLKIFLRYMIEIIRFFFILMEQEDEREKNEMLVETDKNDQSKKDPVAITLEIIESDKKKADIYKKLTDYQIFIVDYAGNDDLLNALKEFIAVYLENQQHISDPNNNNNTNNNFNINNNGINNNDDLNKNDDEFDEFEDDFEKENSTDVDTLNDNVNYNHDSNFTQFYSRLRRLFGGSDKKPVQKTLPTINLSETSKDSYLAIRLKNECPHLYSESERKINEIMPFLKYLDQKSQRATDQTDPRARGQKDLKSMYIEKIKEVFLMYATMSNLSRFQEICQKFRDTEHFEDVIDLALKMAAKIDPDQRALSLLKYEKKKDGWQLIREVFLKYYGTDDFEKSIKIYCQDKQRESLTAEETVFLNRCKCYFEIFPLINVPGELNEMIKSTDEIFHIVLYEKLHLEGPEREDELMGITSDFIKDYIKDNEDISNKKWLYYDRHQEYGKAATKLIKDINNHSVSIDNQARIDNLAKVINYTRGAGMVTIREQAIKMKKCALIQQQLQVNTTGNTTILNPQELFTSCCQNNRWDLVLQLLSFSEVSGDAKRETISKAWANMIVAQFSNLFVAKQYILSITKEIEAENMVLDPSISLLFLEDFKKNSSGKLDWVLRTLLEAGFMPSLLLDTYLVAVNDQYLIEELKKEFLILITILLQKGFSSRKHDLMAQYEIDFQDLKYSSEFVECYSPYLEEKYIEQIKIKKSYN